MKVLKKEYISPRIRSVIVPERPVCNASNVATVNDFEEENFDW